MRIPTHLQRYVDRIDAMSPRERILVFLASAVILVAIADSAFFEPILRRQKAGSQMIQQQQDEIHTMQMQLQAFTQARSSAGAGAKQQRLDKRRLELAALDRDIAAKQSELVTPERMAKMLAAIFKRNRDVELVSFKSLAVASLASSQKSKDSSPAESSLYRHGVELVVSGSYLNMLGYVSELERLPAKIFWGNMDLQAAYPLATLKITLYTLSPDKTWLLI